MPCILLLYYQPYSPRRPEWYKRTDKLKYSLCTAALSTFLLTPYCCFVISHVPSVLLCYQPCSLCTALLSTMFPLYCFVVNHVPSVLLCYQPCSLCTALLSTMFPLYCCFVRHCVISLFIFVSSMQQSFSFVHSMLLLCLPFYLFIPSLLLICICVPSLLTPMFLLCCCFCQHLSCVLLFGLCFPVDLLVPCTLHPAP